MPPDLCTLARRRGTRTLGACLGRYLVLWSVGIGCLLQASGLVWAGENTRHTVLHGAWLADDHEMVGRVDAAGPVGGAFELHLLEAIGRRAQLDFSLQRMDPGDVAAAFASGRLDFALPAQRNQTLAEGARFSRPYGVRNDVLMCNPHLRPLPTEGMAALKEAVARDWRIAVRAGESYGAEPDVILAGAHERGFVRWVNSDLDLVEVLLAGETTCVLAPRLELMVALTHRRPSETFIEHQRIFLSEARLRILFNTATVDAATIDAVDRAVKELQEDGTVDELRQSAVQPTLLAFAVATPWFSWFDIIGTIAFALSGVLIAQAEGFSLPGAFVLSALPAVGGGALRDLLVGREPIGIVASPLPLTLVAATVATAYVLYALRDRLETPSRTFIARLSGTGRWPRALSFRNLLELTDAIGLAAFTVIGVVVAVRVGAEPLWLWGPLCAAMSGAGGGILRDILRVGYNNPALRASFYAEVCVVWGFLLSLAVLYLLTEEDAVLLRISIFVTVLGALATRLLVVAFKVRSPRF